MPQDSFQRLERLAPLGYFAMGIGWLKLGSGEQMLAIANGSDWTPQPLTLHASHPDRGYEKLPCWFSDDYDHHMGLAVGDLTGNGYDDIVVAVISGKNQNLAEGGIKVYLGGPGGLDPHPLWLARGFAATGVALAPFDGGRRPDILVSCLSEGGTIQKPDLDEHGRFTGRARLLVNHTKPGSETPTFEEHVIEHEAARGAGDVFVADVDLDGELDVVFASGKTSVLYGNPRTDLGSPWKHADYWTSNERHPYSFAALAFTHPSFPGGQLIASSRGLMSATQLAGRTLEEIQTGVLIHVPSRGKSTPALQRIGSFDPQSPQVPAGLGVAYGRDGHPSLVAGFLDARGRDIRGAPVRIYPSALTNSTLPFAAGDGQALPGGGLMAGRVEVTPRREGPSTIAEWNFSIERHHMSVLTLPASPAGDLLYVDVEDASGRRVSFSSHVSGRSVSFSEPLPYGGTVCIGARTVDEVEVVAASSAAWPPAGASGVWRGQLTRHGLDDQQSPPPVERVRQAG